MKSFARTYSRETVFAFHSTLRSGVDSALLFDTLQADDRLASAARRDGAPQSGESAP